MEKATDKTTSPAVRIKNLKKTIDGKTIINNLSFDVNRGEVFGFLGPNGAGKTTTIRMMFGLTFMTEGEIFINGYSVTREFEKAMASIGGIIENPDLYKFLTGYQNLQHFQRMYDGIGKERVDEIVRLVGLEKRIHDKVKTYSLGMRQRLGIAQAMLHSPSVLVLDEPTNGLDPAGIKELRDYLKKIAAEENVAVVVSSHLLSEVELMCDRVGIIQAGSLVDVVNLNEYHAAGLEELPTIFSAEPAEKAVEILNRLFPQQKPVVHDDEITVVLKREQIAGVVETLVQEGVGVYGVRTSAKTLEDRFLEVTGGKEIV